MTANAKAAELKSKLFKLLTECKDFHAAIRSASSVAAAQPHIEDNGTVHKPGCSCGSPECPFSAGVETVHETAEAQADQVACALADVYDRMGEEFDLFFDAARDDKDQSFAFSI